MIKKYFLVIDRKINLVDKFVIGYFLIIKIDFLLAWTLL